jgi:ribonuclease P protein component
VASHRRGKVRRIGSRRALELTVRTGEVVRCPYFKLRYRRGVGPPGVGFLAGRRVGGAVERNRAKRVLREAFRASHADLSDIETLVFIATEETGAAPFAEIRSAVDAALRDASDQAG